MSQGHDAIAAAPITSGGGGNGDGHHQPPLVVGTRLNTSVRHLNDIAKAWAGSVGTEGLAPTTPAAALGLGNLLSEGRQTTLTVVSNTQDANDVIQGMSDALLPNGLASIDTHLPADQAQAVRRIVTERGGSLKAAMANCTQEVVGGLPADLHRYSQMQAAVAAGQMPSAEFWPLPRKCVVAGAVLMTGFVIGIAFGWAGAGDVIGGALIAAGVTDLMGCM
jgi:hypothetical protein